MEANGTTNGCSIARELEGHNASETESNRGELGGVAMGVRR